MARHPEYGELYPTSVRLGHSPDHLGHHQGGSGAPAGDGAEKPGYAESSKSDTTSISAMKITG